MKNLRIFLTSDIHLGLKFSGYPEIQKELADARFETLEKCVLRANEEKCHIFAVGGDMFDKVTVAKRDVIRAAHILSEFEGNVVAVMPGNHDYISLGQDDLWAVFRQAAGSHVLLLEQCKVYHLDHYDVDADIYPAPCDAKHSSENFIGWVEKAAKDESVTFHVGMAHGSLEGLSPDFNRDYFPMTETELVHCGLDVWLMGHTHIPYPNKPDIRDQVFFPATPEPDGFDCRHEGKALILDIDENKKITPRSISTGKYRFHHDDIRIKDWSDIKKVQDTYTADGHEKTLLKLKLSGRLPEEDYSKLPQFREALNKHLAYLQIDDTEMTVKITADVIEREFTQGSFPYQLLSSLVSANETETLQEAYDIIRKVRS